MEYTADYYRHVVEVGDDMKTQASGPVLQTAIVRLPELSRFQKVMEIASIISNTKADGVYVVPTCDTEPRREIAESLWLTGATRLVYELVCAGTKVYVGFCGSESILYRAAGAQVLATGKFFNLRRFSPSRFEPSAASGGGQLAYFFEESLLTYLREADLARVRKLGLLSNSSNRNQAAQAIINKLEANPGSPWVGLSWRQYLSWFVDVGGRIAGGESVEEIITTAEANWRRLEDEGFLMEEPRNDGSWVRPWRIALRGYKNDW